MKRLKECRNFGELYEAIGEKSFGSVAYFMTLLLICVPIAAGIINAVMLWYERAGLRYYDAYEYNYNCMTLWNIPFSLMLFWTVIYVFCKIGYNKWNFKGFILAIKEKQPWLLWWLALLVWTIIPVSFSPDPFGSIVGTGQLASGYISHFFTLGVLGCVYMITDKEKKEKALWMFIGVTDVLSLIQVSFEYNIPPLMFFSAAPRVSVYTQMNHYGYMIAMSFLTITGLYYKVLATDNEENKVRKEIILILSIILQSFAIVINDTLGSYLAIVISLLLVPILWSIRVGKFNVRYLLPLVIVIAFTIPSLMGIIPTQTGSSMGPSLIEFGGDLKKLFYKTEDYRKAGTTRAGIWEDTIKRIKERPIVGYGPEIIQGKDLTIYINTTPHNEFLECAYFLGIPGLILYLGGLVHLFIIKIKSLKKLNIFMLIPGGVIICYLIGSFTGVRKFNTVCYFFMFIGLLISREQAEQRC